MKPKTASIFCTGTSQAARLPKEFRFEGDTMLVGRKGSAVSLDPAHGWPEGYVKSFAGVPEDFVRQPQSKIGKRRKLG